MRLTPFFLALAFLAAPGLVRPAQSQTLCGPTAEVLASVVGKFAERPRDEGLIGPARQARMIFFTNDKTGTWTVVILTTKGAACIVAAGHGLKRASAARPPGKDI